MKKLLYLFAFLMVSVAGAQDYAQVIQSHLNNNRTQLGLLQEDVEMISISTQAYSNSMKVNMVYATQQYNGIDIFNTTSSFAVKNGNVANMASRFEANLASRVNTSSPSINATSAITKAAIALGVGTPSNVELLQSEGNNYVFSNSNISLNEIPVRLVYQPTDDNSIRLAWEVSIYLLDASHYYNARIDAQNGQLLAKSDYVVSCDFGEGDHSHAVGKTNELFKSAGPALSFDAAGGAQYRVFPIPFSSPLDGADQLVPDPANSTASPFGWHDVDGAAGAEYTITRGNNVWAQDDLDGNNGTGTSPDGGGTLDFDFPYDLTMPPVQSLEASLTNLFYWNNIIHDFTYLYGFDEEFGNFQENNYGNPGNPSDHVFADGQDGSGTNNANFSTPPDGANPRMQMFNWTAGGGPVSILTINAGPLAGTYEGVPAAFGGALPVPPLTEDIVLIEDDDSGTSTDPNDACDTVTNGGSLSGKIVILNRGECEFGFKGLQAQNEGAVAVIVVDRPSPSGNQYPLAMGGGADGGSVTIPMFMMSESEGDAIIQDIIANGPLNGTISGENVSPDIDGDLDNEIVAHEYGHGVSNRLTGGPVNTSCLQNAEQMGEGWSDYLGLIMTMQTGDAGEDVRGLAAYASGNPNGIREAPYSIDFAVNDYTYADTNSNVTQPHGIGFVWATALWDMTWLLIDEYGFDADLYNGTGGNNIAMQLVMDGMKLQPCSPGFIDGRDAILEADELSNGGDNKCLIWEAFAGRGIGESADQGSSNSRSDQTEAYDIPAECNLGFEDSNFDRNFKIYPNPSTGMININSAVSLGDTKVSIFDMNGRKVFTTNIELGNQGSINATGLTAGVYVIKIDGGNYAHTSKLIIK